MGAVQQILLGTGLLTFSALVHAGAIALSIPHFPRIAGLFGAKKGGRASELWHCSHSAFSCTF